jgi:hypothetical protein
MNFIGFLALLLGELSTPELRSQFLMPEKDMLLKRLPVDHWLTLRVAESSYIQPYFREAIPHTQVRTKFPQPIDSAHVENF